MSKQRRSFTPEYKEQVARMVVEESRAIPSTAREIGVNEQTLRNWKSLGYQRSEGGNGITGYVSLPGEWRLWLRLDDSCVPNKLTIVEARRVN